MINAEYCSFMSNKIVGGLLVEGDQTFLILVDPKLGEGDRGLIIAIKWVGPFHKWQDPKKAGGVVVQLDYCALQR